MFGHIDPDLKAIVQTELTLDIDDGYEIAKRDRMLRKMKRNNERDYEALKEKEIYFIHDSSGNLIPFKPFESYTLSN